MPGFLLDSTSVIMCSHGGQAQTTMPNPRVKVNGRPVVVQTPPHTIAGCPLPSSGLPACLIAQWVTGAVRVKASGMPVLLQDSQAICPPNGTPVVVVMTQMRVKGM
jgi:hypothetical protein